MLDVSVVGQHQYEVARNTQKILQDHNSLQDIIVILDMDELTNEDKLTVVRVCKVKRFLSQSFFVAEIFTEIPGKFVDLKTSFSDFDEVLSGNCDDTLETAFCMVGDLMDVKTHRYLCSIKGHTENWQSSGKVRFQNIWRGLRTLSPGLAQRLQENATSMNLHELRI